MNDKEFENNELEDDDLEDYDLNKLFGQLADLEGTANMFGNINKKDVKPNDISYDGMYGDINSFSSMDEIMSLGKMMEDMPEEEKELTEEEKAEEEAMALKAYNNIMGRLGSLESLKSFESMQEFIDKEEE